MPDGAYIMSGKLTTISVGWVERSETQHQIKVKSQKSKVKSNFDNY